MIQIDMPMPESCRMCPACSEYDECLIQVDGKGFGEQDVSEFINNRPNWCPLKEQEAVKPRSKSRHGAYPKFQHFCGNCNAMLHGKPKFCSNCGRKVKWK